MNARAHAAAAPSQAVLNVLIRTHREPLASEAPLLEPISAVHRAQDTGWSELQRLLHSNLCTLGFLSRTHQL